MRPSEVQSMSNGQTTVDVLASMIEKVIGEDWDPDQVITAATSFSEDLELESIEFVALAEELQEHYGAGLNFVDWLSSKEIDEIIHLKVGDVAEFIDSCLS